MTDTPSRWPVSRAVTLIAAAIFLAHVAVSWRHGFFRDELYFIDCGRRPAFGYADQPPIAPLLAAATQVFGHCLVLLRLLPALAHACTALITAMLAGLVAEEVGVPGGGTGGGTRTFAPAMAAAATLLSPMYLGLHTTFGTTTFEALAWTYIAYAMARATLRNEPRRLITIGVVTGLCLETKYAVPFFMAPLLLGVLVSPSRKVLFSRHAAIGAALATAIALPSLVWQVAHGLPFRELLHAASHGKNVVFPPLEFATNQLLVHNPILAPLWLSGVGFALFARSFARVRFLAFAFVGVFLEMLLLHGKEYYPAPAYAVAFALGAVVMEKYVRSRVARVIYVVSAAPGTVMAAPVAMPILDPPVLVRYLAAVPVGSQPQENNQKDAVLPQDQADMLGWQELEAKVLEVYRTLTPQEQAHVAIIASNYGEAGALNFYGPSDGLPRAVSGHNQYWFWGPGNDDVSVVIRVNGKFEAWKDDCDDVKVAATFGAPYVMPYEHDRPILLCRGMHPPPLRDVWSNFKHID